MATIILDGRNKPLPAQALATGAGNDAELVFDSSKGNNSHHGAVVLRADVDWEIRSEADGADFFDVKAGEVMKLELVRANETHYVRGSSSGGTLRLFAVS